MTGPELFELGGSIIDNIAKGRIHAADAAGNAALAAACFAGSQAAVLAILAVSESEDDDVAKAWADAIGMKFPVEDERIEA